MTDLQEHDGDDEFHIERTRTQPFVPLRQHLKHSGSNSVDPAAQNAKSRRPIEVKDDDIKATLLLHTSCENSRQSASASSKSKSPRGSNAWAHSSSIEHFKEFDKRGIEREQRAEPAVKTGDKRGTSFGVTIEAILVSKGKQEVIRVPGIKSNPGESEDKSDSARCQSNEYMQESDDKVLPQYLNPGTNPTLNLNSKQNSSKVASTPMERWHSSSLVNSNEESLKTRDDVVKYIEKEKSLDEDVPGEEELVSVLDQIAQGHRADSKYSSIEKRLHQQ